VETSFNLTGDKQLERALKNVNKAAEGRALRKATKAGAEVIVQEARNKAPYKTGKLKRAIRSKFGQARGRIVTVEIGPAPRAHYGGFLEVGTSRMPAQPFLRPAMDETKQEAVDILRAALYTELVREAAERGR